MKKTFWTPLQIIILEQYYPGNPSQEVARLIGRDVGSVHNKACSMGIKKTAEFLKSEAMMKFKSGRIGSELTQFKKGQKPWNTGTKGVMKANSGCFQKGQAPHNTRHDGCVSIRQDRAGYKYKHIRISKGKWQMLHVVVWEKAHGPVPEDHLIVFRDRDSLNCDLANLECITNQEKMRRNSGPLHLTTNMVATYMATRSRKVDHALRDALLQNTELIELKRAQLLLDREVKKALNEENTATA